MGESTLSIFPDTSILDDITQIAGALILRNFNMLIVRLK